MKAKPKCDEGTSCGGACISSSKNCEVTTSGRGKMLSEFLHQADHLGENVASWKIGKLVGPAIAQVAIAAGVPAEVANIAAESVVQAGAAAAIHAVKHTRSNNGEFDAKDTASHFVQQLAAAALGKVSHHGMEGLLEYQAAEGIITSLAPLIAGKGAGILTASKMKSSGLDRRLVEMVTERSKADINRLRSIFAPKATAAMGEVDFADLDKEAVEFLFDLTMQVYLLAYEVNKASEPQPA